MNKKFIDLLIRYKAPTEFPVTGERARRNDFSLAFFILPNSDLQFYPESFHENGATGFIREKYAALSLDASLTLVALNECRVSIEDYYRTSRTFYHHRSSYVLGRAIRAERVVYYKDKLILLFYRYRPHIRKERMAILRFIAENSLQSYNYQIGSFAIAQQLHGTGINYHRDHSSTQLYYDYMLNSLVSSGDLTKGLANHTYILAPKGLATLSEADEADRRHRSGIRQQVILGILTFALVIIGFLQVIAAFLSNADAQTKSLQILEYVRSSLAIF